MKDFSRRGMFALLAGVAAAPLVGDAKPKPMFDYGPGPKIIGVDYAVGIDESRALMYDFTSKIYYGIAVSPFPGGTISGRLVPS